MLFIVVVVGPLLPVAVVSGAGASQAVLPVFAMAEAVRLTASAPASTAVPAWLAVVLVLGGGMVVKLASLAIGLVRLAQVPQQARQLSPLPPAVRAAELRVGVRARYVVSADAASPITFGHRRPVVVLPEQFLRLGPAEQEGIVTHELMHVARGDWRMVLVERAIAAILWFHPAVWILSGRIELSREQLVDARVVETTGNRRAYLEALWQTAAARTRDEAAPVLPVLTARHLVHRVAHLTREVTMSRWKARAALCGLVGVLFGTLLAAGTTFPVWAASSLTPVTTSAAFEAEEPIDYEEAKDEITEPKAITKVPPQYPEEARKNGVTGLVSLRAVITKEGGVDEITVESSDDERLSQAAIDALRQWQFEPATHDGKPVAVWYVLTFNFNLS